ncbi:hypothetical protein KOW79_002053 [Hemibagrus wyckioides]|uniref:Uncharacterized protein n=1 Tax=Hemibagrus wyckioides TaxID=337641 RepID=A0A9D3P3Z9_9TELE|nr:hypothetical protein KOW79_002053 [Hemibagrus wyckioides]
MPGWLQIGFECISGLMRFEKGTRHNKVLLKSPGLADERVTRLQDELISLERISEEEVNRADEQLIHTEETNKHHDPEENTEHCRTCVDINRADPHSGGSRVPMMSSTESHSSS